MSEEDKAKTIKEPENAGKEQPDNSDYGLTSMNILGKDPTQWLSIPHMLHTPLGKLMGILIPGWNEKLSKHEVHCLLCEGKGGLLVYRRTKDSKTELGFLTGYVGSKSTGIKFMIKPPQYMKDEVEGFCMEDVIKLGEAKGTAYMEIEGVKVANIAVVGGKKEGEAEEDGAKVKEPLPSFQDYSNMEQGGHPVGKSESGEEINNA